MLYHEGRIPVRKDIPASQFLDSMIARAKADKKTIVLPEGNDIRTLKAAEAILAEGIADLIVLGDADDIAAAVEDIKAKITAGELVPCETAEELDAWVAANQYQPAE